MKDKDLGKNIGLAIVTFLIFYLGSYLFQYLPIVVLKLDTYNMPNALKVLLSLFSSMMVAFILFLIYRKDLVKEWKLFKKNKDKNLDIMIKYWLIGLSIMLVSNFILTIFLRLGESVNEETVQSMIKALPWAMLIDAGIIAPFIEELVFRKAFKNVFKNKYIFVILTSLFFAYMHLTTGINSPLDYLFIIPYGALGAALAGMYVKTDTIYTSMIAHIMHNTILILFSIFM